MAGYTRNDTGNNIADGNVINASDLDGEFDSIQTAFNETSGHTHDGTVGEGAPISVVGPAQDINVTITEVVPKTTNTMSLGTAALQFKDLHIDGTANIDSLVADTADINAGTIDGTTIGGTTPAAVTGTTITGTSFVSSGNMFFADDAKAIFGAGSDLQIYHNAAQSANFVVSQTGADMSFGTAGLINLASSGANLNVNGAVALIQANDQVSLSGATVTTTTGTSGVVLDNNGSPKLATTSTGIDVTGTITADGLTATTADINGGTIDGVTIGGASAGAGTFTSVTGTSLDMNGNADVSGTISMSATGNSFLTKTTDAGGLVICGGSNSDLGANVVFYGASQASLPNHSIMEGDTMLFRPVDNSPEYMRFVDGTGAVFNETGADLDFRIESEVSSHAFFLQGSDGKIGIGTPNPSNFGATVNIIGAATNGETTLLVSNSNLNQFARFGINGNVAQIAWDEFDSLAFGVATDSATSGLTSEYMRIDSSGDVGIGTSSPTSRLEVADVDGASGIEVTAFRNDTTYGNSYIQFNGPRNSSADGGFVDGRGAITLLGNSSSNTSSLWINASSASLLPATADEATMQGYQAGLNLNSDGTFAFWDSGSQRFLIDASGNVGIGTSDPGNYRLNVAGSGDGRGGMFVQSAGTGSWGLEIGSHTASSESDLVFTDNATVGSQSSLSFVAETDGYWRWMTGATSHKTGTGGATEVMRIDSSGNVGIGTSSPAEKLEIATNDESSVLRLTDTATIGAVNRKVGGIEFYQSDASGGAAVNSSIQSYHANISGATDLRFYTGDNSERVRITSSGSVGIGTSSPQALLDVTGTTGNQLVVATDTNAPSTEAGILFKHATTSNNFDGGGVRSIRNSTNNDFGLALDIGQDGASAIGMFISGGESTRGFVGIRTGDSPQTQLHVDAGTKNYTGTSPGLTSYAVSIESGSTGTCGIGIGSHNNIPSIQGFGGGTSYNLALCPANGKVAIGHTTPSQALDVIGSIEVSGGIYLGGTGAANLLEDYEEGTWTPAFAPAGGAFGSISYAFATGSYTKVGRLVTVIGRLQLDGTAPTIGTAAGSLYISGLPFTVGVGQNFYTAMSFTFLTNWASTLAPSSAYVAQNTTYAVVVKRASSDGNEVVMTADNLISAGINSGLMISATYYTA